MPFDGSGNFSRLYSWQSDRDNGIKILASRMDGEFDNFAGGMNVVFFRNGLVPMSGNLNLGQNYINGVGAGAVSNPAIRFADDATSGLFLAGYNRPSIAVAGTSRLEVNANGAIITGTLNSTGNLSENGSRVWTAATLNLGNYAQLSGANFTGAISGTSATFSNTLLAGIVNGLTVQRNGTSLWGPDNLPNPVQTGQNVTFGDITASRGNGTGVIFLGTGSGRYLIYDNNKYQMPGADLVVNGGIVWHSVNFNPANYAQLNGSPSFATVTFGNDAQFFQTMNGGNPFINVDSNDYVYYNRSQNKWYWAINGSNVMSLDSSGALRCAGNVYGNLGSGGL